MPQTNPSKAWGYKNIIVGRKLNFLLKAVIDHIHLHTVEFFFHTCQSFPYGSNVSRLRWLSKFK